MDFRHLAFGLVICILSLLLGACSEAKEKTEAYVEEIQERGQVIGFHKVNVYTKEKSVNGVIKSTSFRIVDAFDQNGNYVETEVSHSNTTEADTPLTSVRRTMQSESLTIFLEDAPLFQSSTITLSSSEQERLQQHIKETVRDKFSQQNNPAYKEILLINISMLIMIFSLFIVGLIFKRFKWHLKFAEKILIGILSTILLYFQLKGIGAYSTKSFLSILLVFYCILGYQLVKDVKQRTKEKVSQNEI